MPKERIFSAAFTEAVNDELLIHLLRADGQEDLTFALYTPSTGRTRTTALIHTVILPEEGERAVHGNASFHPAYLKRVALLAMQQNAGIVFLHSHTGPGWQGMSQDDVEAETYLAGTAQGFTGLPLVGLTVGTDGTWSARFWQIDGQGNARRHWCQNVRTVGRQLKAYFDDEQVPPPAYQEAFKRTITVWGEEVHKNLTRLKVGIVGLGSVGSHVAEALARMGFTNITLIDFDQVKVHNLDRLAGASVKDEGRLKVEVAAENVSRIATAAVPHVEMVQVSVTSSTGYHEALDCDVLFSCVDRPRARQALNHMALAHLIPVIDGGVAVDMTDGHFGGASWRALTVTPGRPCLQCAGQFDPADAELERQGLLEEDSSYMRNLPVGHRFKRNENVHPFTTNLASLEVMQLIALATGVGGAEHFGIQRYWYLLGTQKADVTSICQGGCVHQTNAGRGEWSFQHYDEPGRVPCSEATDLLHLDLSPSP